MASQEAADSENIMLFNEKLLSFCGMLPPKNARGLVTTVFPFFTAAVLSALLLIMVSLVLAVYQEWNDLQAASMAFCILCGFTASFGDSVCFVLSRKHVLKLVEEMRIRFIRSVPAKYRHLPIVADRIDKKVTTLALIMYLCVGLLWVISPLMKRWKNDKSQVRDKFLFPTWVPFDLTASPASEIVFLWQIFSMSLGVYTICCVDTFIATIMHQVCVQFDILSRLLSDMTEDTTAHRSIAVTSRIWNDNEKEILQQRNHNDEFLLSCIEKHQDILEFFKRANALTSIANVFQLANIPFVMCITGFHITLPESTWDDCLKHAALAFVALMKLLLLCWYGQQLIDQSLEINRAMYDCRWVNQSLYFKKLMPMIMMRSQKPVNFTAGLFYNSISFVTFTTVLNTTYSYFTLLRQVKST